MRNTKQSSDTYIQNVCRHYCLNNVYTPKEYLVSPRDEAPSIVAVSCFC